VCEVCGVRLNDRDVAVLSEILEIEELTPTARGEGGFGSTGR